MEHEHFLKIQKMTIRKLAKGKVRKNFGASLLNQSTDSDKQDKFSNPKKLIKKKKKERKSFWETYPMFVLIRIFHYND